jgi:SAM-dependent methyltransferase
MSPIFAAIDRFARFFGGETGPAGLVEQRYILRNIPPHGWIVDVGGGDGRLAREIAALQHSVLVLDREETLLPGADTALYKGSLQRLVAGRGSLSITPVRGDATAFPLASGTVDAIVSCQLLEHLDSASRQRFFEESARCLKPGGSLAVSTPSAAMLEVRRFWVSPLARRMIRPDRRSSLPLSLQGPWLLQSLAEWETKVGHFGHGCPADELAAQAQSAGLRVRDRRASETGLTAFWHEVACTFPLIAMLAAPLVRLLFEIEWNLPPRPGMNLLMTFQKPLHDAGRNQ